MKTDSTRKFAGKPIRHILLIGYILSQLYPSASCYGQESIYMGVKKGESITSVGFMINLYGRWGDWIFQPCPDSSIFVLDALNEQSFSTRNITDELGYTFFEDIENLGTKLAMNFYDLGQQKALSDTIKYFYCRLTVHPEASVYKRDTCQYILFYKGDAMGLSCTFFQHYITELEPLDSINRAMYLEPFYKKKWPLPEWADD